MRRGGTPAAPYHILKVVPSFMTAGLTTTLPSQGCSADSTGLPAERLHEIPLSDQAYPIWVVPRPKTSSLPAYHIRSVSPSLMTAGQKTAPLSHLPEAP